MPKVLQDRVLISIKKTPSEYMSPGGIILQNQQSEEDAAVTGLVEAVGPKVESLKVGNIVEFPPFAGQEIEIEGKDYLIIRESDIYFTKPQS